jgi:hypothetical protein
MLDKQISRDIRIAIREGSVADVMALIGLHC